MIKKTRLSLVLMSVLAFASTSGAELAQDSTDVKKQNVIDEIIWVVGDEAILRSEVETERKRMLYQGEKMEGDPYAVIPEAMAVQKLYLTQAKIDSIDANDDEVEAQVEAQINMFIQQIGSKEKLEEYLDKSIGELRSEWRTGFKNQSIEQQMKRKLCEDVSVTPSQVRRWFERLPMDSVPYVETQVEVQMIAIQPRISKQQTDEIKGRLRDYTQRAMSGETQFSTLAILYSEDPGSAAQGGELGFKTRGAFVPEFSNAAFQLTEPGKISKIVETEFGFHIIQLIERRGDRANFRHILLTPKTNSKDLSTAKDRLDSLRNDLLEAKFTFEEVAPYVSSDKTTRNSGGIMTSMRSGASRMSMDELPAEIARQVATMKVGDISKPFQMKDQKTSRDQMVIIRLKNRIDGHKATYYDDYQIVKQMYENHLHEQILDNFVREKQRTTYVRIKPGWENFEFKYPGWGKRSE